MAILSKQINWSQETSLLYDLLKKLDKLIKLIPNISVSASNVTVVDNGGNVTGNVQQSLNNLDANKISLSLGAKVSGVDGGQVGDMSMDDDYLYVCTTGGIPGVAVWKKTALVNTI